MGQAAATAAAVYVPPRKRCEHLPLEHICKQLKAYGFKLKKGLLKASPYIGRPHLQALVKLYAAKLKLDDGVSEQAEKLL